MKIKVIKLNSPSPATKEEYNKKLLELLIQLNQDQEST
jgi:hypothetical protein